MMDLSSIDPITSIWIIFAAFFIFLISFLFGKWQDIVWRARFLRKTSKKDHILVFVRDRDSRTLMQKIVLPDEGTIKFKGSNDMWLAKKGRIYRFEKEEQGFGINKKELVYQEGVPCLFVDYDNVKPIGFADEIEGTTPNELGTFVGNYIDNEIAKDRETMKKLNSIIILTLILVIITIAVCGYNVMKTSELNTNFNNFLNSSSITPSVLTAHQGANMNNQTGVKG